MLVGCALAWTIEAQKPLDTVDAWLWLLCFSAIELNVFGFDETRPKAGARRSRDGSASVPAG